MATQTTARSWSLDSSSAFDNFLANTSQRARSRYDDLLQFSREERAKLDGRTAEFHELSENDTKQHVLLDQTRRDRQQWGLGDYNKIHKPDGNGGEIEEAVLDPAIAACLNRLDKNKTRRSELTTVKSKSDESERVREAVRIWPANFVSEDAMLPAVPKPAKGETKCDVFNAALAKLGQLLAELETEWLKRRPLEEIHARMRVHVNRLAEKGKPRLGGLARGHGTDIRGRRTVATPKARIGWPVENLGAFAGGRFAECRDGTALIAYLFRDELIAKLDADIAADFSDKNTRPEIDKSKHIARLEREIWAAAQLCEEAYLAARRAGFAVDRPADTPAEILLGVLPFNGRYNRD